jgi:hypothetical protein
MWAPNVKLKINTCHMAHKILLKNPWKLLATIGMKQFSN